MDAEDLDRQSRTRDGWLSSGVAAALVEHGHLELLRREAGAGGRLDEAVAALQPDPERCARSLLATLLVRQGKPEDAIAVMRR